MMNYIINLKLYITHINIRLFIKNRKNTSKDENVYINKIISKNINYQ